jgi:predicted lipoprotein with Yx(FWY)xxD motif
MKRLSPLVTGFLMVGVLAACAAATSMAPGGPGTTRQTGLGEVFTDAGGMTLYTYDKDTPGKSNCIGLCAVFWPPVIAAGKESPTGGFTTITRDDGTKQWAYNGKPLYGYISNAKAGDTSGDGVDGVWHAAKR